VLKRFNMEECKPIGTLLDVNSKLLKLTEEEFQGIQEEMQGIPYTVVPRKVRAGYSDQLINLEEIFWKRSISAA
jgi:hypothetical protein